MKIVSLIILLLTFISMFGIRKTGFGWDDISGIGWAYKTKGLYGNYFNQKDLLRALRRN